MSTDFSISRDVHDDHTVVTVSGDVDLSTAAQFADDSMAALRSAPSRFVVDLSRVPFMDSTGITVLVLLRRTSRQRRNDLRLVTNHRIEAVLKLAGLSQIFRTYSSLDAALASDDDLIA